MYKQKCIDYIEKKKKNDQKWLFIYISSTFLLDTTLSVYI